MAAGEQVAFEPPLAHMLAKNFENAAIRSNVIVVGNNFGDGFTIGDLKERIQPVGVGFIGTEDQEIIVAFNFMTSRSIWPRTRVDSARTVPGFGTATA